MERQKNIHTTIAEIKKRMGLDKIPVIHPPIAIKKDGKHLYQVAGYFYPLRWETLERLNIPSQRILYEVDREQWHREMNEAKEKESHKDKDPWDE
jgi:hypothetical protein